MLHVAATCKSAFYHLGNIYKIRRFLTPDTTKSIVHDFVTSRIDYCNSLLYGLPNWVLEKKNLQYVQNSAARLIYLSRKFDHVTPLLITLHSKFFSSPTKLSMERLLNTYLISSQSTVPAEISALQIRNSSAKLLTT